MTTYTRLPQQVVQSPAPKIKGHWLLDNLWPMFVQHNFVALDGKRFLLSDMMQDLLVLVDMHVPTLAHMLNVLQLLF